jgi:hypothetical protein
VYWIAAYRKSLSWDGPVLRMNSPVSSASCSAPARAARICTAPTKRLLGGLNSFYLIVDQPEVYGLPPDPKIPSRNLKPSGVWSVLGAVAIALMSLVSFRNGGGRDV